MNDDLISRSALLADLREKGFLPAIVQRAIERAPAVDAVEVVRCRECKYHHWGQEPCHGKIVHYCELPHMEDTEVFKEFFCYYGTRNGCDDNG